MDKKIICEYCNKEIYFKHKTRHYNSKACRNKQQNKDIILPLHEYICKYCDKNFNRLDQKNEHENNVSCNSKDLLSIIKETKKELELKNELLTQKEEENIFLKSQLQAFTPNKPNITATNYHDNSTNIVINNLNINFSEIQNNLDKFNFHTISDYSNFIKTLLGIFDGKIKLTNECKQVISYYLNDKLINDSKAKLFLCNSSNELSKTVEEICNEAMKKISVNDTDSKKAICLKRLLGDIHSEKGVKGSIRKKGYNELLIEIIRSLKENGYVEIRGV